MLRNYFLSAAVLFFSILPNTLVEKSFNVRDFGAAGDGVTKDTEAFQKALDTCAVSGGGQVIVPEGRYLIGSVQMGYQTILILEPNSVIVGSSEPEDYPMIDIR